MRIEAEMMAMDSFLVVMRTTITMPMSGMSLLSFIIRNEGMEMSKYSQLYVEASLK